MTFHKKNSQQAFGYPYEDSFRPCLGPQFSFGVSTCSCSSPFLPPKLKHMFVGAAGIDLQLSKVVLSSSFLMASQPIDREEITSLEVQSYIQGYHTYQDVWDPHVREVLPLQ